MKKLLFIIILIGILFTHLLSQTTITVPGQFPQIQNAINYTFENLTGPVTILVYDGDYDKIEIADCPPAVTDLTIESLNGYENCIIDGNQDGTRIKIHNSRNIIIQGFTIQDAFPYGDDDGHGVYSDSSYCVTINSCHIMNNTSDNKGGGIYSLCDSLIEISNCQINNNSAVYYGGGICLDFSYYIIENNTIKQNVSSFGGGIYIIGKGSGPSRINFNTISENTVSNWGGGLFSIEGYFLFQNNKVTLNNSSAGGGIYLYLYHSNNSNDFSGNLIANNSTMEKGGGIYIPVGQLDISSCTIVDNICSPTGSYGGGIYRGYDAGLNIINSILWENDAVNGTQVYIECDPAWVIVTSVSYSCIEDGMDGIEFEDPVWAEILDYEINNIELDPLFASTNPNDENYCYLTVESPCIDQGCPYFPFDPDNTQTDMGCYYFHHDYDIHLFSSGWHWESFPRIGIELNGNDSTNIVPILANIDPFGDITDIVFDADDENDLTYNGTYWFPDPYLTQSSWLYKINILPEQERILTVEGEKLPASFDLSEEDPLESGTYHWLGYWLPRSQNIVDAFGFGTQDDDFWQYVEKVKSEDWYYNKCSIIRGGDTSATVSWSTRNKTLEYGKGYMVWFIDTPPITDFHWTDSGASEEPEERGKSEYFNYEEKSDYEVVDVMNIPENIIEIGVFQDTTCVGAVVVQDSCAQILVYSDNVLRDPLPFNFEIITGRGSNSPIMNYEVLNFNTGKFEKGLLISGRQEYSVIKLGEQGEPEEEIPAISKPMLHGNYPNPFNPTTTISFSLPKEEDIELTIYNIKGQKVKTLYSGIASEGKQSVVWDGRDTNGKEVGSGLYFYQLETKNKELTKKMLLLK